MATLQTENKNDIEQGLRFSHEFGHTFLTPTTELDHLSFIPPVQTQKAKHKFEKSIFDLQHNLNYRYLLQEINYHYDYSYPP